MTRNIISRKDCQKQLLRMTKAERHLQIVLFSLMLLLFVPLFCMSVYVVKYVHAIGIAFAVICASWQFVFLYKLTRSIMRVRLVRRGGFSIVKDRVHRLSKGELIGRNRTANVIYFTQYGRFIPDKTTFDLASMGDEFYLVVLHTKK